MSHSAEPSSSVPESELVASETPGFKLGQKKTLQEYAELDKEDESLAKWKASLGLGPASGSEAAAGGPQVVIHSLALIAPTRSSGPIVFDLSDQAKLADLKKQPVTIKEGEEYSVEITFTVKADVVSGLKYLQAVRRAGITVDKLETMIGSYGASSQPTVKQFVSAEAPSGMLARSGTYSVRSRVVDDDKTCHIDFEWQFKIGKEW